jgi:hypothetical protein
MHRCATISNLPYSANGISKDKMNAKANFNHRVQPRRKARLTLSIF